MLAACSDLLIVSTLSFFETMSLTINRSAWGVSLNVMHPDAAVPAPHRACPFSWHAGFPRAAGGCKAPTGLTTLPIGEYPESAARRDPIASGPQPWSRQAAAPGPINLQPEDFTAIAKVESRRSPTPPRQRVLGSTGQKHAATHAATNPCSDPHGIKHTIPKPFRLRRGRRQPQSQPNPTPRRRKS